MKEELISYFGKNYFYNYYSDAAEEKDYYEGDWEDCSEEQSYRDCSLQEAA